MLTTKELTTREAIVEISEDLHEIAGLDHDYRDLALLRDAILKRWIHLDENDELSPDKYAAISHYGRDFLLHSLITEIVRTNQQNGIRLSKEQRLMAELVIELINKGTEYSEMALLLANDFSKTLRLQQREGKLLYVPERDPFDVGSYWISVARRLHEHTVPRALVSARNDLFNMCRNRNVTDTEVFRIPWQIVIMERRANPKAHQTWFTRQARPPRGLHRDEHPQCKRTMRDVFYTGSRRSDHFGSQETNVTPITEVFDLISETINLSYVDVRVVYWEDGRWQRRVIQPYDAELLKDCRPILVRTSESALARMQALLRQVKKLTDDDGTATGRLMQVVHKVDVLLDAADFPEIYKHL